MRTGRTLPRRQYLQTAVGIIQSPFEWGTCRAYCGLSLKAINDFEPVKWVIMLGTYLHIPVPFMTLASRQALLKICVFFLFLLALQPNAGYGLHIHEGSRSHTTDATQSVGHLLDE